MTSIDDLYLYLASWKLKVQEDGEGTRGVLHNLLLLWPGGCDDIVQSCDNDLADVVVGQ